MFNYYLFFTPTKLAKLGEKASLRDRFSVKSPLLMMKSKENDHI
jgi:hypothetical protein